MKPSKAVVIAIVLLASRSSLSAPLITPESAAASLCVKLIGPAFIIPDESRSTIAVRAGPFTGVSFFSLATGHAEWRIPVSQPLLAASMPRATGTLVLALSDGKDLRITSYDAERRRLKSTRAFGNLNPQSAVFTPNAAYLLGVTTKGTVFKIDLATNKVDVIEDIIVEPGPLAVSPTGAKLYVRRDGLTVIDVDHMRVASQPTAEENLIEVVTSPDDHTLVLRNLYNIELFDLTGTSGSEALASAVVDPEPNGASIGLTSRLAVTADGSEVFYIKASNTGPELISLSMKDLRVEARLTIGPRPNAIATLPDRHWVLFTAGFPGQEQLEAVDTKTQGIVFKVALAGGRSRTPKKGPEGCLSASNDSY